MPADAINLGIVGAGGRGGAFAAILHELGLRVRAICELDTAALEQAREKLGAERVYTDYEQMLDDAALDAVLIGTPMPLHAKQAIAALQRDIHVLCEVTAAVSLEQCREVVHAAVRARAIYMMAENYIYTRPNQFIKGLVEAGLFGDVYYAEGEYLHELKLRNEQTPWRRHWQTGLRAMTYPTHSLGPILSWMPGDRIARLCCEDTGSHHRDRDGNLYATDSTVMLAKTEQGRLIKLRLDMISDRPHAMMNYQLQGTDGAYESSREGPGERDKVWLRTLAPEPRWLDLATLAHTPGFRQHLPAIWRDPSPVMRQAGHGGGDYVMLHDFARAVRGEIACPINVHRAMDLTLPALLSQTATETQRWVDVPDSRDWLASTPRATSA
ncbi:MAG: Gfo/Idh/MocA family oxidoreductase [Phycisphaeraceae bacterium]